MSRQSRGISDLWQSLILPEKLNSLQAPFLASGGALPEIVRALRRDRSRTEKPCSPTNSSKPPSLAARPPPWTSSPASSGAPTPRRSSTTPTRRPFQRAVEARRAALAGKQRPTRKPPEGRPGASQGLPAPGEDVRPRPPARPRPQRQGQDHALGALPEPPDREGQGLWRRHREGAGGARGAPLGLPQPKSGLCFPSYETIAEAAHCARSTVAEALQALEDAGVLSWVQRIKRVREPCPDLLGGDGWRWRVLRTSNGYAFPDPSPAAGRPNSSKSEKPTGTPNQDFFSSLGAAFGGERTGRSGRKRLCEELIAKIGPRLHSAS